MRGVTVEPSAEAHLEDIYDYSFRHWGEDQAERYIRGLRTAFTRIAEGIARSRAIPSTFGVEGRMLRHERHFIYWRDRPDGNIGIIAVLHQQMDQPERVRRAVLPTW